MPKFAANAVATQQRIVIQQQVNQHQQLVQQQNQQQQQLQQQQQQLQQQQQQVQQQHQQYVRPGSITVGGTTYVTSTYQSTSTTATTTTNRIEHDLSGPPGEVRRFYFLNRIMQSETSSTYLAFVTTYYAY